MDILTHSRMKAHRKCQMYHKLRYNDGWQCQDEAGESLAIGTLVHVGLEAYMKELQKNHSVSFEDSATRFGRVLEAMRAAEDVDPFFAVEAEEMVAVYILHWESVNEEGVSRTLFEPVEVEASGTCPLPFLPSGRPTRDFRLGFKVDAIVKLPTFAGFKYFVLEHKTTTQDIMAGSPYWDRLAMDSQLSMYTIGAEALGYDIEGRVYDVLVRPGVSPHRETPPERRKYRIRKTVEEKGMAENDSRLLYANQYEADESTETFRLRVREKLRANPAEFLVRRPVPRIESQIKDFILDAYQTVEQIRAAKRADRAPRNPDACIGFGQRCEFFNHCAHGEELRGPRFVKTEKVVEREISNGNE